MKYQALIVEDEIISQGYLKALLREFCPELQLAGVASNVEEATRLIDLHRPEIVFMDIEMQTGTGFDVLQQVQQRNFHVIFTTAFDHYAIKAIKFSAIDYLLKPINPEELQQAVSKAIRSLEQKHQETKIELLIKNLERSSKDGYSISLSTSEGIEYIKLSQIIRLEANGPYTTFYTKHQKKIMVSKNLKEYELLLCDHNFFRIHNSYIINVEEITKMVKTDGGYVIMSDDSMITISPKKKDEFIALMAKRLV